MGEDVLPDRAVNDTLWCDETLEANSMVELGYFQFDFYKDIAKIVAEDIVRFQEDKKRK